MSHKQVLTIEKIPVNADSFLRRRLGAKRVEAHHIILALAPDGAGVTMSSVGPVRLRQMAEMLIEIAERAEPAAHGSDDYRLR